MMHTLKKEIIVKGIGIHSGEAVTMTILPASTSGIRFEYNNSQVMVNIQSIGLNNIRATSLTNHIETIHTPEHFLAACYALKLTNLVIILSKPELPILDGSAMQFIELIKPNMVKINGPVQVMAVHKPFEFTDGDSSYSAAPADEFIIDATI